MKYTYLLVNFFSVVVPFLFSFHPKIQFHKHFKAYFQANLLSATVFLIWDSIFVRQGIWGFSSVYTMGWNIYNLPLEEILFFFCIPFACIFTYHCLNTFSEFKWSTRTETIFVIAFSFCLLVVGMANFSRLYTSVTFISTALFVLLLKFYFRVNWLPKFFKVYPLLLIPFFIVNGILTGYGFDEPVVWYDNTQNLSIRLATIPIEDIFYGIELLLLTLFFYEKFKIRF